MYDLINTPNTSYRHSPITFLNQLSRIIHNSSTCIIELRLYESVERRVGSYDQVIRTIEVHLFLPANYGFSFG